MKKVLLLEDDLALGQGICLALKSEESQIDWCRSLNDVRSKRVSDYALLILDINLPDGCGLDYLRRLRTNHRSVPVILLTANDMETEALVADISHQTKTPIANILLYAQLLDEQDIPEDAKTLVASLIGQSEKLKTLIEALVKTSWNTTCFVALMFRMMAPASRRMSRQRFFSVSTALPLWRKKKASDSACIWRGRSPPGKAAISN